MSKSKMEQGKSYKNMNRILCELLNKKEKENELKERVMELKENERELKENERELKESYKKLEESYKKLEESEKDIEESEKKLEDNNKRLFNKLINKMIKENRNENEIEEVKKELDNLERRIKKNKEDSDMFDEYINKIEEIFDEEEEEEEDESNAIEKSIELLAEVFKQLVEHKKYMKQTYEPYDPFNINNKGVLNAEEEIIRNKYESLITFIGHDNFGYIQKIKNMINDLSETNIMEKLYHTKL